MNIVRAAMLTFTRELFAAKLLVEFWDVVVPLGLVEVSCDRISEVVLAGKLGHRLTSATRSGAVRQMRLGKVEFSALFVQQEDVAM